MATSFNLPTLHKSHFLGQKAHHLSKPQPTLLPPQKLNYPPISSKFNLYEILGGRGLCNGEQGLQQELQKPTPPTPSPPQPTQPNPAAPLPENAFEKELLGLTGGFPGGEKGLQKFIQENPPPVKEKEKEPGPGPAMDLGGGRKSKPPELPMLMPGMIAIVKNRNSPYYMYCGIVQRITDGKAGVLFEGGNWDRLITFRLDELERREKGPPMASPRSVVLESMVEN